MLFFGVACSDAAPTAQRGDAGADAVTSTAPVTVDNLVEEVSGAFCQAVFNCPSVGLTAVMQALLQDPTRCVPHVRASYERSLGDLVAQLRAGTVRLDSTAARRCIDVLASRCSLAGDFGSLCRDILQGSRIEGQECWQSYDCSQGLFCDHGDPSATRCPGACRPRKQPGATCQTDSECTASAGQTPTCLDRVCTVIEQAPAVGETMPCGVLPGAGTTARQVGCTSGLACVLDTTTLAHTCRRVLAEGAPCGQRDSCPVGTVCMASAGSTVTTCRRVPLAHVGEQCSSSGFPRCDSLDRLECTDAGVCASTGSGAAGAHCAFDGLFGSTSCNSGLYCRGSDSTCQPLLSASAPCDSSNECASASCVMGHCTERACR